MLDNETVLRCANIPHVALGILVKNLEKLLEEEQSPTNIMKIEVGTMLAETLLDIRDRISSLIVDQITDEDFIAIVAKIEQENKNNTN